MFLLFNVNIILFYIYLVKSFLRRFTIFFANNIEGVYEFSLYVVFTF